MVRASLRVAIALCAVPLISAKADPFSRLTDDAPGKLACFQRDYPAEHLAKHAKQKVDRITVGLRGPDLWIGFREKGDARVWYATGACDWSLQANIDTSGNRMLTAFRQDAGAICLMTLTRDSAEEAGSPVIIDPAADGRSITLYEGDVAATTGGAPGERKARDLKLGPDDRVFRLERVEAGSCARLDKAAP